MTTRLPTFITFTGLDARTDLARAAAIASRYPVEWGVLLSASRQENEPRYPDGETLSRIWWSDLRIAAHICGEHARMIMRNGSPNVPADLAYCSRVQVNHPNPDPFAARDYCRGWGDVTAIVQMRGAAFPAVVEDCDWLFDRSGGEGKEPDFWPRHPGGERLVGYAGGINPGNVRAVIETIASTGPYWIDMESGVRTDDWLDLDKVEAVCRAVYER